MATRPPVPLSCAQYRFWLLDRIHPGNPAYHISMAYRLRGALDREILARSLDHLIARHEILRTIFPSLDGEPRQQVNEVNHFPIEWIDLRNVPGTERNRILGQTVSSIHNKRFHIDRDHLFRAAVIQIRSKEWIFLIVFHHIICDGISMQLFRQELGVCYSAYRNLASPNLPTLSLTYAQYSIEQKKRLEQSEALKHLAWWKRILTNSPVLNLPTDRTRPKRQSFAGARYTHHCSPAVIRKLEERWVNRGTTLFIILLAFFNVLLSKLSGQRDIVVGTPIAGRDRIETWDMQGLYLNNIVLRTRVPADDSFKNLLHELEKVAWQAYDAMSIPFEKVIEELHPERDQSRTPLFQVAINMLNRSKHDFAIPGMEIEKFQQPAHFTKFDLTLYLSPEAEGLELSWVYNRDLFNQDRIEAMAAQYLHFIDQVLADPEVRINDLSLVTPESRAILPDPVKKLSTPDFPLVTQSVLEWAIHSPDLTAIQEDATRWTYRQLVDESRKIAKALQFAGFVTGDVIAVCEDSNRLLVAALLGTWLAGGVVLPIDPEFPAARKKQMLMRANARCLVSQREMNRVSDWSANIHRLDVNKRSDHPLPFIPKEAPAYIFFTSGTSAEPRGILGTHLGLAHFLDWQRKTFNTSPDDRFAHTTRPSFDVLLRDVFLPLTSGSTLVMSSEKFIQLDFLHWLAEEAISRVHLVPSLLKFWLGKYSGPANRWQQLRTIFFAGEPLDQHLVDECRILIGSSVDLINLYGPTETTLAKSAYRVPELPSPGIQAIGRPLPQTQLLILDRADRLCGIYQTGEITIRTPFTTLGYLGSPDTTYIANPFNGLDSDKLFRTGDLGCYLPDGVIAITGRKDKQLKIRGIRINPQEVSAVLSGHADVQNNVVLPFRKAKEDFRLAAYVVPASTNLNVTELRQYLINLLPKVCIPFSIILVDSIPLTANGKTDRAALPDPIDTEHEPKPTAVPKTETEKRLIMILTELLRLNTVSIYSTFFELGGQSLLAIQLVNCIRDELQADLPLDFLFEDPRVCEIAARVDEISAMTGPGITAGPI